MCVLVPRIPCFVSFQVSKVSAVRPASEAPEVGDAVSPRGKKARDAPLPEVSPPFFFKNGSASL